MRHIKQMAMTALVLAVAGGLSACGSLSHDIARDGNSAGQLVWPAPDDTTPLHDDGTSPTLTSVRQIHAGMTKNQIKALIGAPHFSEGVWSVHEWNYLFHLLPADGGTPVTCQYKVLFDEDYRAQSFYWKPESCAGLLARHVPTPAPQPETFNLSADTLFAFDSAQLSDAGHTALDALVDKIGQHEGDIKSVRVIGYTDRLGSKSYNGLLSRQRAHAVLRYLQDQGVPGNVLTAAGLGEGHPVKTDCADDLSHASLVACLAPNRRVQVQVFGGQ